MGHLTRRITGFQNVDRNLCELSDGYCWLISASFAPVPESPVPVQPDRDGDYPEMDWDLYPGNEAGAFDHLDNAPVKDKAVQDNTDNAGKDIFEIKESSHPANYFIWLNGSWLCSIKKKNKFGQDLILSIPNLQQENTQLKARNEELRKALKVSHNSIITNDAFLSQSEWEQIEKALKEQ